MYPHKANITWIWYRSFARLLCSPICHETLYTLPQKKCNFNLPIFWCPWPCDPDPGSRRFCKMVLRVTQGCGKFGPLMIENSLTYTTLQKKGKLWKVAFLLGKSVELLFSNSRVLFLCTSKVKSPAPETVFITFTRMWKPCKIWTKVCGKKWRKHNSK